MQFTYVVRWLGYNDTTVTSNPTQRKFDWSETIDLEVTNGGDSPGFTLPVGQSKTLFDNSVSTSVAADTIFTWALSTLDSTTYRLTYSSGTVPAFRTNRGLTNNADSLDFVVNSNATVTVTGPAGAFTGVALGDTLFFPGPTTGDAATPVNVLNQGYWEVIGGTLGTTVILRRPSTDDFMGLTETVVITANSQVVAFGANGVQVGQTVELFTGFPSTLQKSFTITAVTPSWLEVFDSTSLPTDATSTAIATPGIAVYEDVRQALRIQSDQNVTVTVNGTSDRKIVPIQGQVGWHEICEPVWSLEITNTSTSVAEVLTIEVI